MKPDLSFVRKALEVTLLIAMPRIQRVVVEDFEFNRPDFSGRRPDIRNYAAYEVLSDQMVQLDRPELDQMREPPFGVGRDILYVSYYSPAELTCYLALGWPMQSPVIDLCVEHRTLNVNGWGVRSGMVDALAWYGLEALEPPDKELMRKLAQRCPRCQETGNYDCPYSHFSVEELRQLGEYVRQDVLGEVGLLGAMASRIDWPRALLRGEFQKCVAEMEHRGTPIDRSNWSYLRERWTDVQDGFIEKIRDDYPGVFEGRVVKKRAFLEWTRHRGIHWPLTPTEQPKMDEGTFKEMATPYPEVQPLREAMFKLGQTRLNKLAIGPDDRNRCMYSSFAQKTGRSSASSAEFVFGPSAWVRSTIQPPDGLALAYLDFSQQEFALAAALSGDKAMQAAYLAKDPYIAFAQQAGAVPAGATKNSHPGQRALFKTAALAVLYGQGVFGLANRTGLEMSEARRLLDLHRRTYPVFWRWQEGLIESATLTNEISTCFGWTLHLGPDPNTRSIGNFPMQAHGGECLRLACIEARAAGVEICCTVHDAVLLQAPVEEMPRKAAEMVEIMQSTSQVVTESFPLRVDGGEPENFIRPGQRYRDEGGWRMWDKIWRILDREDMCFEPQPV